MSTLLLIALLFYPIQLSAEIFTTSDTNNLQDQTVVCSEANCEIQCNTAFGCKNTAVDASASQTFKLSCLANDACVGLALKSSAQLSTEITCASNRSCSTAAFTVSNSPNVILNCNMDGLTTEDNGPCFNTVVNADNSANVDINCIGGYNCNDMQINTANVDVLNLNCNGYYNCHRGEVYCPLASTSRCNITCSGDAFSCSFMDIYIDNVDADFRIDCPGSSAYDCKNTDIHCGGSSQTSSSTLFHDGASDWSCHMDGCCPAYLYRGTLSCDTTQSTQCEMDCLTVDCSRYIIDGTAASSLTVTCSQATGGCGVSNILCPDNGECIINCQGDKSCYQAFVKGTNANSLHVNCDGVESCDTMDVHCPSSASNNNGGCSWDCTGSRACFYGSIAATNSYSLDVNCNGDRACFGLTPVYCPYNREGACNVYCSNDPYACFGMVFTVDDDFVPNSVGVRCPNDDSDSSCGNQLFSCMADGSTSKPPVWMTFDDTQSQYVCDVDPSQMDSACCPLQVLTEVVTVDPTTATPSTAPTTAAPSQAPSTATPTAPTTAAPTRTPTTAYPTVSPQTQEPTDTTTTMESVDHPSAATGYNDIVNHCFLMFCTMIWMCFSA